MSFRDLERGRTNTAASHSASAAAASISMQPGHADAAYARLADSIRRATVSISSNIAAIQRTSAALGSPLDTHASRHDLLQHTQDLIKSTTADIKQLGLIAADTPDNKLNRLAQQKISKDFHAVLARFQQVQRHAAEKSRAFVLQAREQVELHDKHHGEDEDANQPLLASQDQRKHVIHLDKEIEFNESLIAEREQAIVEIEQSIVEVNEIFRDLGTLVTDQQGMLDNIESNIENAAVRSRDAQVELEGAERYQKKSRNRMFCLLGTFGIVLAVLVLVIVFAK